MKNKLQLGKESFLAKSVSLKPLKKQTDYCNRVYMTLVVIILVANSKLVSMLYYIRAYAIFAHSNIHVHKSKNLPSSKPILTCGLAYDS